MALSHRAVLPQPQHADDRMTDFTGFTQDVFGHLPRVDQRRWADAYLCGLLTAPGKKTVSRLAKGACLPRGAAQALQQFISASPWDWSAARESLARKAAVRLPGHSWTVGTTLVEKRGEHSVGVHRRFVPEAGRTVNCQVGIGLFLTSGSESVPVEWSLLMDEAWCGDEVRRRRARVPDAVRAKPAWAHVLELADRLAALKVSGPAPLVIDRHCALDAARLAAHLQLRERDFVLEVRPDQPVLPAPHAAIGIGTLPGPDRPVSARQFMREGGARHPSVIDVEQGGRTRRVQVFSAPVRLPGTSPAAPSTGRVHRLIAEQFSAGRRPARFWLTSLGDRRTDEVLSLLRGPSLTHATTQRLEDDFGLLDFEGRSYPGWHHHMTMSSAAYLYHRLQHCARQPARL
ncbi:IS701 family transposase [Streptomyces sp. WM6378]|uniref:IS701 family transposase n=1 Tax=Streptomyces sp. WM6378 TaxID=1415557 RepID=UPI003B6372E7